jgi:hypothetical protein
VAVRGLNRGALGVCLIDREPPDAAAAACRDLARLAAAYPSPSSPPPPEPLLLALRADCGSKASLQAALSHARSHFGGRLHSVVSATGAKRGALPVIVQPPLQPLLLCFI